MSSSTTALNTRGLAHISPFCTAQIITGSINQIAPLHNISSNFPLEKGGLRGFSRSFKSPLTPLC